MNIQSVSVWQTVKAAALSIVIGVALSLLFALFCYFFPIPRKVVLIVTQTIKAVSLLSGCLLCLSGEGGWWKGLIAGAVFCALSFLVFSTVSGNAMSIGALIDLLVCLITGALGGIAAVNLKRA
jgi:putative membrane protein (TIGR04086 family)